MSESRITAGLTVNEITLRSAAALAVFHRHGIDACCGGALPLGEVAAKHGLDLDALLEELSV